MSDSYLMHYSYFYAAFLSVIRVNVLKFSLMISLIIFFIDKYLFDSSQLAGKMNAHDAIPVFQQNTEEEVSMFNWIMTNTPSMLNQLRPKIESSITTNSK
jgi:hypothetical protein